ELEGWAGREAETAVRAAAQDPVGLAGVIRIACPVSESSLHDRSSKYPLPDDGNADAANSPGCRDGTGARQNACVRRCGLNKPVGSNCCFSLCWIRNRAAGIG